MLLNAALVTKLLGAIETDTLVFLCGAGLSISAPSNLLSAAAVANRFYDDWLAIEALDPALRDDIDLLAAHFYARGDFEHVFIPKIPWNDFVGEPNRGHATVADFLICRAARGALSANFDGLIEGWAGTHKVCIRGALTCQDAEAFDSISRPLVKFHGCLLRAREKTLWTRAQLGDAAIAARMASCTQWMHVVLPGRHLLVVGFWTDWGYLNEVLAGAFAVDKAASVTVIDTATSAELQAKAPDLWAKLNSLSDAFEHVQASGNEALAELQDAFSRAWARRFFGLGAILIGTTGAPVPAAAATAPDALGATDLYNLRRDAEGRPYTDAAQLKAPHPTAAQAACLHLKLLAAGATQRGAWLDLRGRSIRIVNGAGQGLTTVQSQFKEPATAPQADIVVCAGSIDLGVPGPLISHGRATSIVRPSGGGTAKWITFEQATTEFGL
jgi:hypothetical protein